MMQISIEEILQRNYGVAEPFDKNGRLTEEGQVAYDKLIAVLADVGDFFNTNVENWIDTFDTVVDSEISNLNKKEAKIFTFLITYINEWGREKEVAFCACDREEATNLFNNWCRDKEKQEVPHEIVGSIIIYDQADAEVYGKRYGLPGEYVEKPQEDDKPKLTKSLKKSDDIGLNDKEDNDYEFQ